MSTNINVNVGELKRVRERADEVSSELWQTLQGISISLYNITGIVKYRNLTDNSQQLTDAVKTIAHNVNISLRRINGFLDNQITKYAASVDEALVALNELISLINGNFAANKVINVSQSIVSYSGYRSVPEKGFVVTTNNQKYVLSTADKDFLCAIVAAESDKTSDDALAVASTILNRCEAPNWIASHGTNPISQAKAPNQFVVYQEGHYTKYLNGNYPDAVETAVTAALNGTRNHDYLSFRSNGSTRYSDNMISPTGNRYK